MGLELGLGMGLSGGSPDDALSPHPMVGDSDGRHRREKVLPPHVTARTKHDLPVPERERNRRRVGNKRGMRTSENGGVRRKE